MAGLYPAIFFFEFTFTQNATLQRQLLENANLIYSTFSIPINKDSIAGFAAATGESLNIRDSSFRSSAIAPSYSQIDNGP